MSFFPWFQEQGESILYFIWFQTNLFFLWGDSLFHQEQEFECGYEQEFECKFEWNTNLNANLNRNLNRNLKGNFFSNQKHVEQEKVGGFYSTVPTSMKLPIYLLTDLDKSSQLT